MSPRDPLTTARLRASSNTRRKKRNDPFSLHSSLATKSSRLAENAIMNPSLSSAPSANNNNNHNDDDRHRILLGVRSESSHAVRELRRLRRKAFLEAVGEDYIRKQTSASSFATTTPPCSPSPSHGTVDHHHLSLTPSSYPSPTTSCVNVTMPPPWLQIPNDDEEEPVSF